MLPNEADDAYIEAIFRGRAMPEEKKVGELRENPYLFDRENGYSPTIFVVKKVYGGQFFKKPRKFIECLEAGIVDFYDNIASKIKKWTPMPPSPVKREQDTQSQANTDNEI